MPIFRQVLPRGEYFATTWTIKEDFGGLTKVLLHRASLIASLTRRKVKVLTLAPDLDVRATAERLAANGQLAPSIPLLNLWDDLRTINDDDLRDFAASGTAQAPEYAALGYQGRSVAQRFVGDTPVQLDHFRTDGTRAASDVLHAGTPGKAGTRYITVFDRSGTAVGTWKGVRTLQRAWLDKVIGGATAYLINDSQSMAPLIASYRRDNVTTAQVIHNAHLSHRAVDAFGEIERKKVKLLEAMPLFDLVTPLTHRQLEDLTEAGFGGENLRAIPNSKTVDTTPTNSDRPKGRGVMLARLTPQKHPEDAVRAAARASRAVPDIHLDIFGDGPLRPSTERAISKFGAQDCVSLRGFDRHAVSEFSRASFSVLSSRHEGMPLVLLESMAAGCIPVAYDVRYGPSDIITDGVNGFLVEASNPDALGEAMAKVALLSDEELTRMREAARQRALQFSDEKVLELWGAELRRAARRKPRHLSGQQPMIKTVSVEISDSGLTLAATLTHADEARTVGAHVVLMPRSGKRLVRRQVEIRWPDPATAEIRLDAKVDGLFESAADEYDVYLDVEMPGAGVQMRIPKPAHPSDIGANRLTVSAGSKKYLRLAVIGSPAVESAPSTRSGTESLDLFDSAPARLMGERFGRRASDAAPPVQIPDGHSGRLPGLAFFGLTWTIAENFGGMTSVFLHRSKVFSDLDGHPIDLLTLAPDLDVVATEQRLRDEGRLGQRARLRNVWTELRAMTDTELAAFGARSATSTRPPRQTLPGDGRPSVSRLAEASGATLQVDRFRQDGSRLASDERDAKVQGKPGGRLISLFDRQGRIVGQWTSASALYSAWIDHITGSQPSVLIIDSASCASLLVGYHSPTVLKTVVLHSAHLVDSTDIHSQLVEAKTGFGTRLDEFDLVSTLTRAQRADVVDACLAAPDSVVAIPNSRSVPELHPTPTRKRADFLLVARLVPGKRIDHAIEAIRILRNQGLDASLTIVGTGTSEAELRDAALHAGVQDAVTFVGFDPNAAARFGEHRYSLLTSRHEGHPLVLIESQAAGCVPISYDIKYGPSEIIDDRRSGFLVPDGDVRALAKVMSAAAELSDEDFQQLSAAARSSARSLSDEASVDRWASALTTAWNAKMDGRPTALSIGMLELRTGTDDELVVHGELFGTTGTNLGLWLSWLGTDGGEFGRVRVPSFTHRPGSVDFSMALPAERLAKVSGSKRLFLDVTGSGSFQRLPLRPRERWSELVGHGIHIVAGEAGQQVTVKPVA